MDEAQVAAFEDVQRRTIDLVAAVSDQVREGMSAADIGRSARERLTEFGLDGWFRPCRVLVQTQVPGLVFRAARTTVAPGATVVLSMAPRRGTYWGDLAVTFVHGQGPSDLVTAARECTLATMGYAGPTRCAGELFVYARAFAVNHRLRLCPSRDVGYQVQPAEGLLKRGFPQLLEATLRLRRNRLHFLNPRRLDGLYVVGPTLVGNASAACFLEMLLVHEHGIRPLGRSSLHEVGILPA
jgi:hypothetical protein